MTVRAALIDFGGTLVDFFGQMGHFPMVPVALRSLSDELTGKGFNIPSVAVQEQRWNSRKRDSQDLEVKPLEGRLAFIFDLDPADESLLDAASRAFMRPVYHQARLFEDALPFLNELRERRIRTVLVSNTTWGSPAHLWREQLVRYGLDALLDDAVFCRDVGWRKPDRRIFHYALEKAGFSPEECLFIGDDPGWDIAGPGAVGIPAVLVDRRVEWVGQGMERVTGLSEIIDRGYLGR